ncbi:MAG: preprotein translocase subunit SecG [Clostridia bacterium]|nr:preprotein translocase subunit SecG [Clostridia bacterium]
MSVLSIIIGVLQILASIAIIIVVLLQSGKAAGLSGSIAGGAETFFGKNKGRSIDSLLEKYTGYIAIGFLITSIMLYILLK